jgi:hypothetical protein
VAILDSKRFELGVSDDAALAWRDGFTSIIAPTTANTSSRYVKVLMRATQVAFTVCT